MAERPGFVDGTERVRRLAERADLAPRVAEERARMHRADLERGLTLDTLRRAADLTQTDLARRLGVSQAAVSRMEQRHDLLLSTLTSYVEALGGRMRVVVEFPVGGPVVELDLSTMHGDRSTSTPRVTTEG